MYNIMVVDDSPMIVDVFVAMLKRGGYQPIATCGGEECLEILKDQKPDLILLDIMMEPMDGWETLHNIKSNPATRDVPVMMLTAKQLTPEEAQKYSEYIEDYLMKPTTHKQLYEVIEYVLKRRERISEEAEKAKKLGADPGLIYEFECLSKRVDVAKRLLKVMEETYVSNDGGVKIADNISHAIEGMQKSIKNQETCLEQIKSEFKANN